MACPNKPIDRGENSGENSMTCPKVWRQRIDLYEE